MGRFRQLLTSISTLGTAGAVANAGRLQVERRAEDLAIRRLERVVRRVEALAEQPAERGMPTGSRGAA
jgi:hypothetical protein